MPPAQILARRGTRLQAWRHLACSALRPQVKFRSEATLSAIGPFREISPDYAIELNITGQGLLCLQPVCNATRRSIA